MTSDTQIGRSHSKLKCFTLAALILALATTALAGSAKPHGQVVSITVHGASLENNRVKDSPDRAVSIYLPPGYDSDTSRYPVIYLLHGYTETRKAG